MLWRVGSSAISLKAASGRDGAGHCRLEWAKESGLGVFQSDSNVVDAYAAVMLITIVPRAVSVPFHSSCPKPNRSPSVDYPSLARLGPLPKGSQGSSFINGAAPAPTLQLWLNNSSSCCFTVRSAQTLDASYDRHPPVPTATSTHTPLPPSHDTIAVVEVISLLPDFESASMFRNR